MSNKITPFLWFNGKAKEAMEFYVSVFRNSHVDFVTDHGGGVVVVGFELEGQKIIGMDAGPAPGGGFNESFSMSVDCADQEEVDYLWGKLTADGGEESMCGWLKDKFGLSWQITPRQLPTLMSDPDPEKAGRVVQAMMQMRKIVVADLEKAYRGE